MSYNEKVRFDGDIIITDPCYIIREDKNKQLIHELVFENVEQPKLKDYYSIISKYGGFPDEEEYPDCEMLEMDDPRVTDRERTHRKELYEMVYGLRKCLPDFNEELDEHLAKYTRVPYSVTYRKENKAYLEAYAKYEDNNPNSDWDYCEYGEGMQKLGLTTFLCNSTIYGDWSCTTFDTDTKEPIGRFCADAGQVAVFLLDEVLKYNPDFDYHINRPWTTTLIRDFHGTVELRLEEDESGGSEVTVVGCGNVNFIGCQTGF